MQHRLYFHSNRGCNISYLIREACCLQDDKSWANDARNISLLLFTRLTAWDMRLYIVTANIRQVNDRESSTRLFGHVVLIFSHFTSAFRAGHEGPWYTYTYAIRCVLHIADIAGEYESRLHKPFTGHTMIVIVLMPQNISASPLRTGQPGFTYCLSNAWNNFL